MVPSGAGRRRTSDTDKGGGGDGVRRMKEYDQSINRTDPFNPARRTKGPTPLSAPLQPAKHTGLTMPDAALTRTAQSQLTLSGVPGVTTFAGDSTAMLRSTIAVLASGAAPAATPETSFVPVSEIVGQDFARSYIAGTPYEKEVLMKPDHERKRKQKKEVEREDADWTIEHPITHPPNSVMGWRDAGSFACISAAPPECHGYSPYCVAFSQGGELLVSCGHDATVKVWTADTMEIFKTLHGHKSVALQCAFTADEQHAISLSSDELIVWILSAPRGSANVRLTIGGLRAASTFTLSPDNSTLVITGMDAVLHIWDWSATMRYHDDDKKRQLTTEYQTHTLPERGHTGHKDKIVRLAFSFNNAYLLSCSYDKTVMLWDIRKNHGGAISEFKGHDDHVLNVCWHESGRMFASCSHDGKVLIWRIDQPVPLMVLKGNESIVYGCSFLADSNRVLTLSNDEKLILFNSLTGGIVKKLSHIQSRAKPCLAVNAQGTKFAVASTDKRRPITVWTIAKPSPLWRTALRLLFFWIPESLTAVKQAVEPARHTSHTLRRVFVGAADSPQPRGTQISR